MNSIEAIGCGRKVVLEYIKELKAGFRNNLKYKKGSEKDIVGLGLDILRVAGSRDLYTSGLDMMVLGERGVVDHEDDLDYGFEKRVKDIQDQYKE